MIATPSLATRYSDIAKASFNDIAMTESPCLIRALSISIPLFMSYGGHVVFPTVEILPTAVDARGREIDSQPFDAFASLGGAR